MNMKKGLLTVGLLLLTSTLSLAQSETKGADTSKLIIGKKIVKIYTKGGVVEKITFDSKENDTLAYQKQLEKERKKDSTKVANYKYEGHWQGMDFGTSILLNASGQNTFSKQNFLENDPAKSFYMNLNLFEKKLPIIKEYVGLTTGLGFNWTSVGIKNNQTMHYNADSVWVTTDKTLGYNYDKNKLRASYLTVPLFLEFNTKSNPDKSAYLMLGVVGGLKLNSKFIQKADNDKAEVNNKTKGDYALNPFKLDAAVRVGYKSVGVFANYSLLPLFDTKRVEKAMPLSFGLSWVW
jgi:hypothetical protein